MAIRFDVHGRFELEVERRGGRWLVFRIGEGRRRRDPSVFVPAHVAESALGRYLSDLLHELARPGTAVSRIE